MSTNKGPEDYVYWDDSKKNSYTRSIIGPLCAAVGAEEERHGEWVSSLRGKSNGRSFVIRVEADRGTIELHLGFENRRGVVWLMTSSHMLFERVAKMDGFDVESIEDLAGPDVFLYHFPGEAPPMREVLAAVPAEVLQEIGALMRSARLDELQADNDRIETKLPSYVGIDVSETMVRALDVCGRIAAVLEIGDSQIAPRPRMFVGGEAVRAGSRKRCRFCGGAVVLDAAGCCPNCGAANVEQPAASPGASAAPIAEVKHQGRAVSISLWDWLHIPLIGGEDRYDDWDDERQQRFAHKRAHRLAASIDAQIEETKDDEITIRGGFGGRRFGLQISIDTSSMYFVLSCTNRKGVINFYRNPTERSGEEVLTDELDDRGYAREYKQFVAPYVYLEEYKEEFQQMQALVSSLSPQLVREIADHMNSYEVNSFRVNSDQIEISYWAYYTIRTEVAIKKALRLGSKLAALFEVGEQQVVAAPRIRVAGAQLASLNKETCQSCGEAVRRDASGRCPECGAVMAGG